VLLIFKSGTDAPYTQITNQAINDKRLSDGAIATLVYLMSKPENWKVYCTSIASRYKRNRRTAQKYLDELITAGYAKRNEITHKDGKTIYTYDVSDKPNNIYSVQSVHTNNIKSPAIIVNTEIKHCIQDLQMTLNMFEISADQPIDSRAIKTQIKKIVAAGIIPKVFCMYSIDYFHGKHGLADIHAFIQDAVSTLTYAEKPIDPHKKNGFGLCHLDYENCDIDVDDDIRN